MTTNHDDLGQMAFDELFTGETEPVDNVPPVESDIEASNFVRLIATRQGEIDRMTELRDAEVSKINDVYNQRIESLERGIGFFSQQLEFYLREANRQDENVKSKTFSSGRISLRKQPDRIEIDSNFKPEENTDSPYVRGKKTYCVDRETLKKSHKNGYELPDWAKVEEGKTKFKVEVY